MKLKDIQRISQQLTMPESPQLQQRVRDLLAEMGYDPDNLYQELEMTSRYVDTHQDISYSNAVIRLHSHSFYEILCCKNTCGVEYLLESQRYRLQQGDIIIVPPGVSHRPLLPEQMPEPYRRDVLWITPEFFESVAQFFETTPQMGQSKNVLFRSAGTKWEFLSTLFHDGVVECERRAQGWEAAVIGNTVTLLTNLNRALQDRSMTPLKAEAPELLDRVMAYIENHLTEKMTLSDVARHFFVSEATVTLTFRKKMGTSFHRCLTLCRLIRAKTLIVEGAMLETVAEQVGFSDYSTFYRSFKQEYGISPRQYRKLQETQD